MIARSYAALCLLPFVGCNCHSGDLASSSADISVVPGALEFVGYVGATSTQSVTVANIGESGGQVTVSFDGGPPFSIQAMTSLAIGSGASVSIPVVFAPTAAGSTQAALAISSPAGTVTIPLSGSALAAPACTATGPCDVATFVPDSGVCLHDTAPDGTACPSASTCLDDTKCLGGTCVGSPKDCDAGSACAEGFCVEGQGCQVQDTSQRCQGNALCQVYGCDPASGCTQSSAPNGTPCSLDDSCQTAEVCLLGSCVGTPVPDGIPCRLWWDPCVDAGCQGGVCTDPIAEAEQPGALRWDAGLLGAAGPFAVDDAGTSYFTGEIAVDGGEAFGLVSYDACGRELWTNASVQFQGMMLDVDQGIAWTEEELVGVDLQNGEALWALDLSAIGCDGGSCGFCPADAGCGPVGETPQPLNAVLGTALSNDGMVYVLVGLSGGPANATAIVAAHRDGTVAWLAQLPLAPDYLYDLTMELAVDGVGNVFALGVTSTSMPEIAAGFDPGGQPLPGFPVPAGVDLEVGNELLFSAGVGGLAEDGGVIFREGVYAPQGSTPGSTIDASGKIVTGLFLDGSGPGYCGLSASGALEWTLGQPGFAPRASPVLGEDGTVYFTNWGGYSCFTADDDFALPAGVTAVDGDAGVVLWSTTVVDAAPCFVPNLALTPSATLLFTGSTEVYAVFVGRNRPATTAPWGRSVGGDNTFRHSVPYGF